MVINPASLLLRGVKGQVCMTEDLGPCDIADCNAKCTSKHAGGEGHCGTSSSIIFTCKCHYNCTVPPPPPSLPLPPPKNKICTLGLGKCSGACNEKCCNENCAARYPGPMEGLKEATPLLKLRIYQFERRKVICSLPVSFTKMSNGR
ncbi:unnamed protein product [Dovyalis caffra]|uniref:Defensin-like protein n=1 Tax=Dovyalis caffra TaxID=77055 RepID=A0AAV1RNS9_9ROSI|nr:unnamed protein product [Dovyalis caffra]